MIHACNGSGIPKQPLLRTALTLVPIFHFPFCLSHKGASTNCQNRRRPRLLLKAPAEMDAVARATPHRTFVAGLKKNRQRCCCQIDFSITGLKVMTHNITGINKWALALKPNRLYSCASKRLLGEGVRAPNTAFSGVLNYEFVRTGSARQCTRG